MPFYIFGVLLAYPFFQKDLRIKWKAKSDHWDEKENRNRWKKREGIDLPQTRAMVIEISGQWFALAVSAAKEVRRHIV